MAKVLTDQELAEIVATVVKGGVIDDAWTYKRFLSDLGELLGNYLGAECVMVSSPPLEKDILDDTRREGLEERYCAHFKPTESTPADGGVFADFDTDVTIEEWKQPARTTA